MAANSSSRGITTLGKRVVNRIFSSNSPSPTHPSPLTPRRATTAAYSSSVYDKNPDELIHAGPVPDDVIHQTAPSGKYWAPHPQTGVFGPATEPLPASSSFRSASTANAAGGSVLEEEAWFRPTSIEDTEKPHSLP